MLGHVRLSESRGVHELGDRRLAIAHGIEDLEPRRFPERLEALGNDVHQLGRQLVLCHTSPHRKYCIVI